jgi:hypothetical protein
MSNLRRHFAVCGVANKTNESDYMAANNAEIQRLSQQLAVKDEQLAIKDRQMAAKDRQIEQLIKRPRTVTNNNRFVVNNSVNCFGRETIDHISDAKYQELLRDPETSVAKVLALQRAVPENENVTVPNVRERRWLVVEEEDGEKHWKSKDKGQVLEQMWESSTCLLEGEADEETAVGARWTRWADRVRSDVEGGGKLYREQLDMVEHCILDSRRA